MLLCQAQPPDYHSCSRSVYDECHQHDARRKEHHLALELPIIVKFLFKIVIKLHCECQAEADRSTQTRIRQ